ncbi:MAG: cytochrome P450 [Chloroflexi bacterium]|nr:MAG: cytochrome P450 [Chloroflexota bacterium]
MEHTATLPAGPKGLPVVGNALQFQRDPLAFMRRTQQQFGRMAHLRLGNETVVTFFRPEHVRYFLMEHPRNFIKPNLGNGANLKAFLGDGLLTTDGEFHRKQRRLVQPAFHKKRVEGYADVMVQFTQEMLETWQAGAEIDMAQSMQQLTLRIILKSLFNIDSPAQATTLGYAFNDMINNTRRRFSTLAKLERRLPLEKNRRREAGERTIDDFVYALIKQHRAEGQDVGDVLSMLLDAQDEGNTMTDKQVHDQVLTFVAAGHETAQNTLSWTFYLLSQHPTVYKKLLAELQMVLAGRTPTVADLAKLPYLEWVINESWRYYPPAWLQGRRALEAFDLDGYHFPANTVALLSQWVTHNLPDIWGDPANFRPERWDPSSGQKVPQGAYFPFGGGPRMCIGMPFAEMETKLLVASILQRFTPRLVPGFPAVPQPRVTLRPKYGMHMILEATPKLATMPIV